MRLLYSFIFASSVLISCNQANSEEQWVPLLTGSDLSDWTIKMGGQELGDDIEAAYQLQNGVLKIYGNKQDAAIKIGHLFYKQPYSHFRLRFEYRFTGRHLAPSANWPEQYGGVIFHAQSPESMGLKQDYPICLEFQLLGGKDTGERSTGNVCTIGTQVFTGDTLNTAHCINSRSPNYEGDQWVRAEMEVRGDSLVRHYIEGEHVLEYTQTQIGGGFVSEGFDWIKGNVKDWEQWSQKDGTPLANGYIGIQAHDPMEYRKMELLDLSR